MSVDKKILNEIERYRSINRYITEQEVGGLPPDAAAEPLPPVPDAAAGAVPPAPDAAGAVPPPPPAAPADQPIDVEADDDVTKVDDEGKSEEKDKEDKNKKEIDVTDLVSSQKKIQKKQEDYFENLFSQLENLESKLSEMDNIVNKLNSLEAKIEKYREKTPEEKLELRTYDSYPFNQKLSDFFEDKQEEMQKTGKNDYVLTADEVKNSDFADIKDSFYPGYEKD